MFQQIYRLLIVLKPLLEVEKINVIRGCLIADALEMSKLMRTLC